VGGGTEVDVGELVGERDGGLGSGVDAVGED